MSEHNIFLVIEQDVNKWPGIVRFSRANCAKLFTRGSSESTWKWLLRSTGPVITRFASIVPWSGLASNTFISSHFFGMKDAENLALRDQGLFVAVHLFADEINTESDLVGENLATKGDELYFQDLPIYNKLNTSSAKVGEKTTKEPRSVASPLRRQQGRQQSPWASRSGSCSPCVTNFTNRLESY